MNKMLNEMERSQELTSIENKFQNNQLSNLDSVQVCAICYKIYNDQETKRNNN